MSDVLTEQTTAVAREVAPKITDIADRLLTWIQSGADFAIREAPDLARQIVTWEIASSIVWIVISIIGIFVAYKMKKFLDEYKEKSYDDPIPIFGFVGTASSFILSFICIFTQVFDITKAYFVPKIFLIEYLSNLVRH